ncbi:MAG: hypothetical protein ACFE8U_06400 [Candidatus Hermodarchaeota archaeon]
MTIKYQYWEPNQGLEEKQAEVYNKNNPDNQQPVTAKDIIDRYEREKIDPKTVQYAFAEDGQLLAYIQARDYPNVEETHIGYPWGAENCPKEVQSKLFADMLEYIKQRKETMTILANAPAENEEIIDFFKEKGLFEKSRGYRYELKLDDISRDNYTEQEYTTRLATPEDIPLLVDLVKAFGDYAGQFNSDEDIVTYFKDRVFKDGHAILVFKGDTLVMASAPLIFQLPNVEGKRLILRFLAYLSDNESAYKPLLIAIAKECVSTGYGTDKPLSTFISPRNSTFANILEKYNPTKVVTSFGFGLKD